MENKDIGMLLIVIGVAMWPIGIALKWNPIPNILALHLLFIFSGIYFKRFRK